MIESSCGFHGPFAALMEDHVREKRLSGFKYKNNVELLRQLERLWLDSSDKPPALSRYWAERFIRFGPSGGIGQRTSGRASAWRQLALFARRRGLKAYCPSFHELPREHSVFTPFIYTREQLPRLFDAADHHPIKIRSWFPGLLLRVLYGVGLRLGEALALTVRDFDTAGPTLHIRHAKNGAERYLPIASSLGYLLKDSLHPFSATPDTPFFCSPYRLRGVRNWTAECMFSRALERAGLPRRRNSVGPRLHDLRHTFAVHRMEKWLIAGDNLEGKLPLLSAYMGHTSLHSTYYYLRVTRQLHPAITQRFLSYAGSIIPEGDEDEEK